MTMPKLFGYTDRLSVKPGETLDVFVHAEGTMKATAQLVRLIHGDQHPAGPGFIEQEVDCEANGGWVVGEQVTQLGSYLQVDDPQAKLAPDGSFTVFAFICPTKPKAESRQTLLGRWDIAGRAGYGLGITADGHLEFVLGDQVNVASVVAETALRPDIWYLVAAAFDAQSGQASIYQEAVINRYNSLLSRVAVLDYRSHVTKAMPTRPKQRADTAFLIAGAWLGPAKRGAAVSELYSGKIDRPGLIGRTLGRDELDAIRKGGQPPPDHLLAYWDTSLGYSDAGIGDVVIDVGPWKLNANGHNRPVRGQTGWNWSGRNDCFRLAPQEYGGIEFHADALTDCNWPSARLVKLPADLRSGAYAMRLRARGDDGVAEDYIPFFVRPKTPTSRLAFLFPTASYIGYANDRQSFEASMTQSVTGMTPVLSAVDVELGGRDEFGLSACDHWSDRQGVCYSSSRRPILNMRPKHRAAGPNVAWQFPADLSIIAWLEHRGYAYDVLTDEDLERDGLDALQPYTCVMTGTHPEYYSERMLDATEDYIAAGGRYIYMGGNGYHWSVAFRADEPWVMECRKYGPAWKTWDARPGEYYMASNGQKGGAWRGQGRPAQKMVGVGFISEGYGKSEFYRRMPDSYHRTVTWLTKGVSGEVIGDSGLAYGGAAGIAIDRCDPSLGTPPHVKLIASSGGHIDNYLLNPEVVHYAFEGMSGSYDYRIRADMAYFTAPNDGAVFSAGSVAFGQALPINGFDNNVSRILSNVVDAFIKDGALPGSQWVNEEKQWR
ncbi:N,N-dimethylformamidase beta subunit family domain-containing protein [Rhodopseudomonas palustris]|uniref:LamG domain-containing protein n=1 Tax=Rhodopseudomonas palustris TaxID=1076 RepID=A0A418VJJ0_RHOPL|nr:N,N-dimethylformamidase beta subunit family domain-containing protein [Rhodopseudomonas palustris]RJF76319.1 LamG domain-containing protein [Rhodopseudomonas palustris]